MADRRADTRSEIVERDVIHSGFSRFERVLVRHRRRDGKEQLLEREFQHRGDAVGVLPYDPERRVGILVRQLRVPLLARGDGSSNLIEVPAGHLEEGEDAAGTARREVLEEAGLALRDVEHVVDVFPSAGMITEKLHLYLGRYVAADRIDAGGGLSHEGEDIEVIEWPLARMVQAIATGEIRDAKAIILIQALMLREPGLFAT
ncbi:NUDIX hydrolase [Stappia sp. F7233]|uniref:GDP-mannose pyrophosphatase n=1 Tax=Stappia albiluteola TaxID=2758565 RepID=A0A839AF32_9HYPH|nr:NUDIX hydrolase [Stappia albiluteola]MBA5778313.1 NUDIX hydrolase [Stappia albiluteola]